ncbi:hypothetical protein VNO77_01420 [Canavalia gladiata]|uniref:Uncharacterized protein n=1 Tax=Canavalia gladiata TaxID=3824 RepID=A0AAN9MR69_CANGL
MFHSQKFSFSLAKKNLGAEDLASNLKSFLVNVGNVTAWTAGLTNFCWNSIDVKRAFGISGFAALIFSLFLIPEIMGSLTEMVDVGILNSDLLDCTLPSVGSSFTCCLDGGHLKLSNSCNSMSCILEILIAQGPTIYFPNDAYTTILQLESNMLHSSHNLLNLNPELLLADSLSFVMVGYQNPEMSTERSRIFVGVAYCHRVVSCPNRVVNPLEDPFYLYLASVDVIATIRWALESRDVLAQQRGKCLGLRLRKAVSQSNQLNKNVNQCSMTTSTGLQIFVVRKMISTD